MRIYCRDAHRFCLVVCLALLACSVAAPRANAVNFGFSSVLAETSTSEAADHADFATAFVLNSEVSEGSVVSGGRLEDVSVSLPPGLVGNPSAVQACSTGAFLAYGNCPVDSQVGLARVALYNESDVGQSALPLFRLEPPHPDEEIARFGFFAGFPVFIDVSVRTAGDYGLTATVRGSPAQAPIHAAETIFWGEPSDSSHDFQRLTTIEALKECSDGTACKAPGGRRPSGIDDPKAFITNHQPARRVRSVSR